MSEHVQQVRRVTSGGVATETSRVVDDDQYDTTTKDQHALTATRIVWFVAGVLLILLAFRFVFILLGANSANAFANFIYSISYPLAVPFFGIFGYSIHYGVSRLELSTLVAIAVYAIVAYGITKLLTIRQPQL